MDIQYPYQLVFVLEQCVQLGNTQLFEKVIGNIEDYDVNTIMELLSSSTLMKVITQQDCYKLFVLLMYDISIFQSNK